MGVWFSYVWSASPRVCFCVCVLCFPRTSTLSMDVHISRIRYREAANG